MFCRLKNAKRCICLVGIMLTATASLQQCHALCALLGCAEKALTTKECVAELELDSKCDSCCTSASKERDHSHRNTVPIDDGFPCGPHCWCCQSPEPREAPRDTTETAKSRIVSAFVSPLITAAAANCLSRSDFQLLPTDHHSGCSSTETCARLCRFLT